MTPVLVAPYAPASRASISFPPSRKQTPIDAPEGLTFRPKLPAARPASRRGDAEKQKGMPGLAPWSRGRLPFSGVLAGSAEPRRLRGGKVPRHLVEPPAAACVFSGRAEARTVASDLFQGSAERSSAPATDFFYEPVTLPILPIGERGVKVA